MISIKLKRNYTFKYLNSIHNYYVNHNNINNTIWQQSQQCTYSYDFLIDARLAISTNHNTDCLILQQWYTWGVYERPYNTWANKVTYMCTTGISVHLWLVFMTLRNLNYISQLIYFMAMSVRIIEKCMSQVSLKWVLTWDNYLPFQWSPNKEVRFVIGW